MRPLPRNRLFALALIAWGVQSAGAQVRVDHGRHTRLQRFARDVGYGTLEGIAFAGVDQARNSPPEWGDGSSGFGKRVASNVGEFVIQEGVTEGLAAALDRPLDYPRCECRGTGERIGHAIVLGVVDQMPSGARKLAIPRIAGAYVGAAAQASWRPSGSSSRASEILVNGTTSLAIGMAINLWHEFVK
jgi:hypothetical protein